MWFEYTKALRSFGVKNVKVVPQLDKFKISKIYVNKSAFDEQYKHAEGASSNSEPNLYTVNTAFCDSVMKDVLKDLSRKRYDVSEDLEFQLKSTMFDSLHYHHPPRMINDLNDHTRYAIVARAQACVIKEVKMRAAAEKSSAPAQSPNPNDKAHDELHIVPVPETAPAPQIKQIMVEQQTEQR